MKPGRRAPIDRTRFPRQILHAAVQVSEPLSAGTKVDQHAIQLVVVPIVARLATPCPVLWRQVGAGLRKVGCLVAGARVRLRGIDNQLVIFEKEGEAPHSRHWLPRSGKPLRLLGW